MMPVQPEKATSTKQEAHSGTVPTSQPVSTSATSTNRTQYVTTTTVHHVPSATSMPVNGRSGPIVVREPTATAVVLAPVEPHPRPPPGAPKGGQYRHVRYCGPLSILFCLLTELWCVAFCPCDTWFLYVAPDGSLWRADGARVTPCLPYVRY